MPRRFLKWESQRNLLARCSRGVSDSEVFPRLVFVAFPDARSVGGKPLAVLGLAAYIVILTTAFSTTDLVQLALIDALCHWCLVSDVVLALLATATVLRLGRRVPL